MEGLHAIGCAWITFGILPKINVVQGAMLSNSVFFIPALLRLSHWKASQAQIEDYRWALFMKFITLLFQVDGKNIEGVQS